jgi:hypothetical protein
MHKIPKQTNFDVKLIIKFDVYTFGDRDDWLIVWNDSALMRKKQRKVLNISGFR